MVLVVDVPIQTAQQRSALAVDVALPGGIGEARHGIVAAEDGVGGLLGEEVVFRACV